MCLGIPGKIVEIIDPELQLARVDVGGVKRAISIGLLDQEQDAVNAGDWVLIHVGFALAKINESEAQVTLQLLEQMGEAYQQEMRELRASRID
ncbi:MAG TPA: HypC/HybG/HupF family hydrogenase formation chaperone [Ktedonobacterales bacterium]